MTRHTSLWLITTIAIGFAFAFTGCNLAQPKPPKIEHALNKDDQIMLWCDIDNTPIDWEKARTLWTEYEPKFRTLFGNKIIDTIHQSQLKAEDFSKFVVSVESFDFSEEMDQQTALTTTRWLMGIDFHGFVPAEIVVFGINNSNDNQAFSARQNGHIGDYDRIDIFEKGSDQFLFSIAIFSASNSQILIGNPEKIASTVTIATEPETFTPNTIATNPHAWIKFDIPEDLTNEIKEFEKMIPIDAGALLSGFKNVTASFQMTDYALNSQFAFEMSALESTNTAYSILNLANGFVIKPALRKSVKDAQHFISSIRLSKKDLWVHYSLSIDQTDTDTLKAWVERSHKNSAPFCYALDLIKDH